MPRPLVPLREARVRGAGWMRNVVFAAALAAPAVSGCVPSPSTSVVLGAERTLTLAPGTEVAPFGDPFRVTFLAVTNDSRCPIDAMCVWAGNAEVQIGVRLGMGPTLPDTLNTGVMPNDAIWWGYRITLVGLTPVPRAAFPVEPQAYRATLKVERFGPD